MRVLKYVGDDSRIVRVGDHVSYFENSRTANGTRAAIKRRVMGVDLCRRDRIKRDKEMLTLLLASKDNDIRQLLH